MTATVTNPSKIPDKPCGQWALGTAILNQKTRQVHFLAMRSMPEVFASTACFMHTQENARYHVLLKGSNLQPGDTRVEGTATSRLQWATLWSSVRNCTVMRCSWVSCHSRYSVKTRWPANKDPNPGQGVQTLSQDSKSNAQVAEKQTWNWFGVHVGVSPAPVCGNTLGVLYFPKHGSSIYFTCEIWVTACWALLPWCAAMAPQALGI